MDNLTSDDPQVYKLEGENQQNATTVAGRWYGDMLLDSDEKHAQLECYQAVHSTPVRVAKIISTSSKTMIKYHSSNCYSPYTPSVTIIITTTTIYHYYHHNSHHLSLSSSQQPPSITIIITTTTVRFKRKLKTCTRSQMPGSNSPFWNSRTEGRRLITSPLIFTLV